MSDSGARVRQTIPEEIMLARLAQSEQMREFFIQVWKQNPSLAKQGGIKVQNLMTQLVGGDSQTFSPKPSFVASAKQRGVSLIELIMFIVIISISVTGILLVMNKVTGHSADTLIRKQAIAVAESLLEEVELQDFTDQNDGVTTTCPSVASAVTPTNRASEYHIVDCYKGFPNSGPATGIYSVNGAAITDLASYTARVIIDSTTSPLGTIAAGSAVRITVTVTDPQSNQIAIDGYRTRY